MHKRCCQDKFGHFLMEAILEHGTVKEKCRVSNICVDNLLYFVTDEHAGYVVEATLRLNNDTDNKALWDAKNKIYRHFRLHPDLLLALVTEMGKTKSEDLRTLTGSAIIKELHRMDSKFIEEQLRANDEFRKCKKGRRLLKELGLDDGSLTPSGTS